MAINLLPPAYCGVGVAQYWGDHMFSFVVSIINAANISRWQVLSGILFCFCSVNLFAGQLNLVWNPSSGDVGGYRLYYGQASGNYTSIINVGNQTSFTVAGLTAGVTYYFAVIAYNSTNTIESGFSNEVSATIPLSSSLIMASGFE